MDRRTFSRTLGGSLAAGIIHAPHARAFAAGPADKPTIIDPANGIGKNGGWTIAVIPDTQNYAKFLKNQENFHLMTEWLRQHIEPWNIQAVLHEGDFVEQNHIAEGGGHGWGDQNSSAQWESAQMSIAKLYGEVPTILATGNHDYGIRNAETRETQFNNYFGLTDNKLTCNGMGGGIWKGGCANSHGAVTLENGAYELAPPDSPKILILSLEWGPRREAVAWAESVLSEPRYQNHLGILLTHAFLNDDNIRDHDHQKAGNPHHYPTGNDGNTHDGEDLWNALVQPSRQIRIVLNGHVMGKHVGYRSDPSAHGQQVHQMLFNAQGLGGGSDHRGNGGDGWLRLLTFEPDGRTLSVRTFSPLLLKHAKNPWRDRPEHQFQLQLG
jgi:hypothetical protein